MIWENKINYTYGKNRSLVKGLNLLLLLDKPLFSSAIENQLDKEKEAEWELKHYGNWFLTSSSFVEILWGWSWGQNSFLSTCCIMSVNKHFLFLSFFIF